MIGHIQQAELFNAQGDVYSADIAYNVEICFNGEETPEAVVESVKVDGTDIWNGMHGREEKEVQIAAQVHLDAGLENELERVWI